VVLKPSGPMGSLGTCVKNAISCLSPGTSRLWVKEFARLTSIADGYDVGGSLDSANGWSEWLTVHWKNIFLKAGSWLR
jgi:hypothetical protein